MTDQLPEPGWYPDHTDPDLWRWWGGQRWTSDTAPRMSPDGQELPPPSKHGRGWRTFLAVLIVGGGLALGLVIGLYINFGACWSWKGPEPECSAAEEYAWVWLPLLSLILTLPLVRYITKR